MERLSRFVLLVPVLAKADAMTNEELRAFKDRVAAELDARGIQTYGARHERSSP